MINSSNNAEFTLNYFIENIQGLVKFIDKLDIQVIGGKCELLVYLTSMDKFVRWLFSKEKNFSRFILKDGICAVFSAPKKYNDTIYIIYKCGIKGCTKETLYGLKTENPWLQKVTRDSLFYIFILKVKGSPHRLGFIFQKSSHRDCKAVHRARFLYLLLSFSLPGFLGIYVLPMG